MSDANKELLHEFILESNEGLQVINDKLAQYSKNPTSMEDFNGIYRAIHTIKGGARFMKLPELEALTHSIESVLDLIREGVLTYSSSFNDLILVGVDYIQAHIQSLENFGVEATIDTSILRSEILSFATSSAKSEKSSKTNAVETSFSGNFEAEDHTASSSEIVENNQIAEEVGEISTAATAVLQATPNEKQNAEKAIADTVVRVNVNLLDKIMNVVGELVLTRNQIVQLASAQETGDLIRLSTQLNSITSELQTDIMTTRMQPIGSILNRFERIVRDMARELDKKINLKIEGKDTELDKTLLEAIKDPLTHMVRNAVDHGMETIQERIKAGKPEEGNVTIRAYHEGGQVTIEISDDGRGIDKQRILAKAEEKGLIRPDEAARMADKEIYNLVFLPGFSTAAKVTNISGRGVGMDVVKTNIEKIGGHIEILTELGKGSVFKMRIPLTLAIIPALIVSSGEESFAIPQINLVELVRLEGDKLLQIEKIKDSEFFRLRGNIIPLARLSNTLDLPRVETEQESLNIVILNADGAMFGLIVDQILDTQEIVVKPLGKQIKNIGIYAGATIMGDGHVALILDVQGLANKCSLERGSGSKKTASGSEAVHQSQDLQEILLFSLSSKGLFAVPLSMITRLEEFDKNSVDYTSMSPITKYRDQPMPLLFLDEALGLSVGASKELPDIIPTFVISIDNLNYGFVVDKIIDVTATNFDLKKSGVEGACIIGTLFVNEKAVSIIDMYDLADKLKLGLRKKTYEITQGKRPTALVVEDTPMFRTLAVNIMREIGFDVLVATNGKEGIDILTQRYKDVQVIISDIEMPIMNGYEFVEILKSRNEYKNIPIIAVTSRYSEADIAKGKSAGFDTYLEKFKKEEIINAVQKHLGRGLS